MSACIAVWLLTYSINSIRYLTNILQVTPQQYQIFFTSYTLNDHHNYAL